MRMPAGCRVWSGPDRGVSYSESCPAAAGCDQDGAMVPFRIDPHEDRLMAAPRLRVCRACWPSR